MAHLNKDPREYGEDDDEEEDDGGVDKNSNYSEDSEANESATDLKRK